MQAQKRARQVAKHVAEHVWHGKAQGLASRAVGIWRRGVDRAQHLSASCRLVVCKHVYALARQAVARWRGRTAYGAVLDRAFGVAQGLCRRAMDKSVSDMLLAGILRCWHLQVCSRAHEGRTSLLTGSPVPSLATMHACDWPTQQAQQPSVDGAQSAGCSATGLRGPGRRAAADGKHDIVPRFRLAPRDMMAASSDIVPAASKSKPVRASPLFYLRQPDYLEMVGDIAVSRHSLSAAVPNKTWQHPTKCQDVSKAQGRMHLEMTKQGGIRFSKKSKRQGIARETRAGEHVWSGSAASSHANGTGTSIPRHRPVRAPSAMTRSPASRLTGRGSSSSSTRVRRLAHCVSHVREATASPTLTPPSTSATAQLRHSRHRPDRETVFCSLGEQAGWNSTGERACLQAMDPAEFVGSGKQVRMLALSPVREQQLARRGSSAGAIEGALDRWSTSVRRIAVGLGTWERGEGGRGAEDAGTQNRACYDRGAHDLTEMLEDDYVVDSVSARMGVQGRSHERCQHGEAIHERMRDVVAGVWQVEVDNELGESG